MTSSGSAFPAAVDQLLQQSFVKSVTSKLSGGAGGELSSADGSVDDASSSQTTTAKLQQYVVSKLRPWSAFFDKSKFRVPRRESADVVSVSVLRSVFR